MIRGMVERLAQQLERRPDDPAGWARLAHAYDVLGLPDKAQAARAREAAAAGTPSGAASPVTAATTKPQDAQGWIARAHELAGLGRAADSLAALKEGNAQFPGISHCSAYLQALAGSADDGRPSPELVAVATEIAALDNKEPDALWISVSPPPRMATVSGRPAIGRGSSARCRQATAGVRWCSASSRRCIDLAGCGRPAAFSEGPIATMALSPGWCLVTGGPDSSARR